MTIDPSMNSIKWTRRSIKIQGKKTLKQPLPLGAEALIATYKPSLSQPCSVLAGESDIYTEMPCRQKKKSWNGAT